MTRTQNTTLSLDQKCINGHRVKNFVAPFYVKVNYGGLVEGLR